MGLVCDHTSSTPRHSAPGALALPAAMCIGFVTPLVAVRLRASLHGAIPTFMPALMLGPSKVGKQKMVSFMTGGPVRRKARTVQLMAEDRRLPHPHSCGSPAKWHWLAHVAVWGRSRGG
jgi:hypothetical protein